MKLEKSILYNYNNVNSFLKALLEVIQKLLESNDKQLAKVEFHPLTKKI